MQRVTATTGRLAGALSIALALPLSFAQAASAVDPDAAAASEADGRADSALDRWRNYAFASVTPRFSWALVPTAEASIPHVTDALVTVRPSLFPSLVGASSAAPRLSLSIATGTVSETAARPTPAGQRLIDLPQSGLERTVVAPSMTFRVGNDGAVGISALLAYQRFASPGLGLLDGQSLYHPPSWAAGETSSGSGVRVDAAYRLGERFEWNAGYQTRVNMDAFSNYRGVYSDPGQFDIPAQASLGLSYALVPSLSFDVGVDRILYSGVTPFTSNGLPNRVLALLGDGLSPTFAWRDLTVYSIGSTWRNRLIGEVQLRYSTRQQPEPTSALLRRALEPDVADYAVSLGWARPTGSNSRMAFVANYAPQPYILGLPTHRSLSSASRVEFEALWALHF